MKCIDGIYDVIIIGGGASGLMCASYLFSKNTNISILLIERNSKIGTKLYVTGNGRCNITNTSLSYIDFNTDDSNKLQSILNEYNVSNTINFFEQKLGLHLCTKDNLVYPYSMKASSVVDSFKLFLNDKIDMLVDQFVKNVSQMNDIYSVKTESSEFLCRNVVFAGGGSAAPKTGSDGNIYKLMLPFSSKSDYVQVLPSLVQFKTLERDTFKLSGTRVKVDLSLISGTNLLAKSSGELMFTDYGVTGICAFDLSGKYNRAVASGIKNLSLIANLMPNEDVLSLLKERASLFPDRSINQLLYGFFTKELSDLIVSRSKNTIDSVSEVITNFNFTISGTLGFDNAQVTSGGLKLSSLDSNCMLKNGVYVIGECVNVDGPCGGYNLQWAWSSAMCAASSILGGLTNVN